MICAIVLAAGRSQRMGTQKLLLPLGGQPVIRRIVDELLRSAVKQVFVVVGRDAEAIRAALPGRAVSFVQNPDGDGDMLSSVRCGLRALPETCEAVLIALGDQPGITHELIAELIRADREGGSGIVVPAHRGKRGHPLLVSARFFGEILEGCDGTGLRGFLNAHPDDILKVSVPTASALADMDTREDYQRHLALLHQPVHEADRC